MYSKDERLEIGRQIYSGEISKADAMEKYHICKSSAEGYVTSYKRANGLPVQQNKPSSIPRYKSILDADLEVYQSMSKDELIQELILAKANELRAKKGYEVKGVGQNKEFISLNNKNTK